MQIRGGPAAVIGDAGPHREFPGHSQNINGGKAADQQTIRKPEDLMLMFYARIAVRLGILMETEPGVTPMGSLRVFLCTQVNNQQENTMKAQKEIISYRRRCNLIGQGTGLSHYILLAPSAETTRKDGNK